MMVKPQWLVTDSKCRKIAQWDSHQQSMDLINGAEELQGAFDEELEAGGVQALRADPSCKVCVHFLLRDI